MSQGTSGTQNSYRGYPYTNPGVIDVPTLNPAEVAERNRWANLPRRPVTPRNPIVYIDLPQGSSVSQTQVPVPPTIRPRPRPPEKEPDPQIVYIDIPESNGSEVSESRREDNDVPEFVQETILYDPFKERRISLGSSENSFQGEPARPGRRPSPPNSLDIFYLGPGSTASSGYATNSPLSPTQYNPPYLTKETSLYGQTNDGFPLSPIPISQFPRPPPSYEEVESRPNPGPKPIVHQPTEVIVTPSANVPIIGMAQPNCKYVKCQHCNANVHTWVKMQSGPLTHYIGVFLFFFMFPLVFILYCTPWCNFFKYKNHYCRNCDKKIGHESEALCQGMVFMDPDNS